VNITVGHGPDFVMRQGKLEMFHTLQIKWYLVGKELTKSELIADRSLFVVTNQFIGKLSRFDNFTLKLVPVESDPFIFELYDGKSLFICYLSLNSLHQIPINIRRNIEIVFRCSVRDWVQRNRVN
jgi:hypothetical protein